MLQLVVKDRIRIDGLNDSEIELISGQLRYNNPIYLNAVKYSGLAPWQIRNIKPYISLAELVNGSLYIPRGTPLNSDFLGVKLAQKIRQAKIIDKRMLVPAEEKYPNVLITPSKEQQMALDRFKEEFSSEQSQKLRMFNTYLNVMEVSSGKTILLILLARRLKQRMLVLVHTQLIMNAWIADLCKVYGEDYRKQIGIIRGPKALVGPHYTIAMAQTWFKRQEMWEEWWVNFGIFSMDESHLAPAHSFTQCANLSPAYYRFGITGTPTRKDGLHPMMYRIFGTPFFQMKNAEGVETANSLPLKKVTVIKTNTKLPEEVERKIHMNNGEHIKIATPVDAYRDYHVILETLIADKERNEKIVSAVLFELAESKRNSVLVVTHRKSHARMLHKALRNCYHKKIALMISDQGTKQIRELEQKIKDRKIRCAVATLQLIKTGASIPPLNRLVIATPIGNVADLEQVTGRIRRKCGKKKDAAVYHVWDKEIPLCHRQFMRWAMPFYRKKGIEPKL